MTMGMVKKQKQKEDISQILNERCRSPNLVSPLCRSPYLVHLSRFIEPSIVKIKLSSVANFAQHNTPF